MTIEYFMSTDGKNTEIKIAGDCDMYSVREFYSSIEKILLTGCDKAILDLNGVDYLDSSGVGAIIRIIRLAKEKQITLRFRGIQNTPRKVLEMSNILSLITEE
ncbi:MAG: STAS domain-containing protein [Treponema sp.]|nr:STAS domain-containing protein [Treponema sp.]